MNNSEAKTLIVNQIPVAAVHELLDLAEQAGIDLVNEPQAGLTMMHALDAFDCEFLLGEVLVTQVEVELGDRREFAMVLGDDPERALARACAALLLKADPGLLSQRTAQLLEREQASLAEQQRQEEQLIASTRVNFELMSGN